MDIALAMVVRDEAHRIRRCLEPIARAFSEVVAVDTGSRDDTPGLLRSLGARVVEMPPPADDRFRITEARGRALAEVAAPWILVLDADETIAPEDVELLRRRAPTLAAGAFLPWRNRRAGRVFDDYKLAFFRNGLGVKFEGRVHSNPQPSFRRLGLEAETIGDVAIEHSLDEVNPGRACRMERLERAIAGQPQWWRYHWFLGYAHFVKGELARAEPLLRRAADAACPNFPVECLNAHLVLAEILARKGEGEGAAALVERALAFHAAVQGDFEVRANRGLLPWLERAALALARGRTAAIRAPEFAC